MIIKKAIAKYSKRIAVSIALGLLTVFLTLWYANKLITTNAYGKTYSEIKDIPIVKAGLLLGTIKFVKNGNPNQYFFYRIDAATELFQQGKIQYLIISGDNSRAGYDEPTDMKNELIKRGIDSTKIYLDYAGFRTFDSMVRVKEVFGQDSILVISQKFHNERAIYIAEKLNMYAIGYNAKDVSTTSGMKTAIREKFARVKVIVDFMVGVEPKFLGEKIEVK